nr:MAG TPA: intron associated endonuclease [Caudoviricetes sp.]
MTKIYGRIYCIENKVNHKKYIGLTTRSIEERFSEHCKADTVIGEAIRKYGVDNFICYEVDKAQNKSELSELEIHYIHHFGTLKNGYNCTIGGDGVKYDDDVVEVSLNKKQEYFVNLVEKENKKSINVNNESDMIVSIVLNLVKMFLESDRKQEKRSVASQILKLKTNLIKTVLSFGVLTLEELRGWESWRNIQNG